MIDRSASSFRVANGDLNAVATAMIGRPLRLSQQQLDELPIESSPYHAATGIGGAAPRSRKRRD